MRVDRIEQDGAGVTVIDGEGRAHRGAALIGCDGVKSAVRQQYVGDPVRVSGHVVYRAVVDARDFPPDLKLNAPCLWAGPDCHLVHYPLRGGEQYNVVVTFHSREPRGVGRHRGQPRRGAVVFPGHRSAPAAAARPAQELAALGHRGPRADREVDLRARRPCWEMPRTP